MCNQSHPSRSIVGAIILALGIKDPLPVVGLVGSLGVGVHLDFQFTTAEETASNVEHLQVLLVDDQACEGADNRRGNAPVDQVARLGAEGGTVQRAHYDITHR